MRSAREAPPGTYVFCVFDADLTPRVGRTAGSMPGAGKPRFLQLHRTLWLAVADAPAAAFSEAAIQRCLQDVDCVARYALGHEAIVESVFRRWPVIPLKLFTVFSSDARAIAVLGARRADLTRLVRRLRGRQEWSARVLPGEAPRAEWPGEAAPGRAYLEARRAYREGLRGRSARVDTEAGVVFEQLGELATETRRRTGAAGAARAAGPVGVNAAFLVPSAQVAAWKARARKLAAALEGRGYQLDISGPWPPYTFVDSSAD